MHLTRLVLTNFRGFASLDLPLDRHLTVLVGRNGSGKSSVLDAIRATILLNQDPRPVHFSLSLQNLRRGETQGTITAFGQDEDQSHAFSVRANPQDGGWLTNRYLRGLEAPIYYGMDRSAPGERITHERLRDYWLSVEDQDRVSPSFSHLEQLIAWFREREDIENQERVRQRDLDFKDSFLEAARQAIVLFLGDGYTNPRIDRGQETQLLLDKQGHTLSAASLSDGERSLVVMAGDLARHMAATLTVSHSVREAGAIVLIDEIELHLHPSWQQRIIPALRETFPNAQFILTTHSPQVLSQVPAESLRILDNFQVYTPAHPVRGRDANAILREVMGTTERPRFVLDLVAKAEEAIDQERLDDAGQQIEGLRELLGPDDSEVVRLSTMLHFLDGGAPASEDVSS